MATEAATLRQRQQLLASEVGQHYRDAGKFAYHFARNKIRFDPLLPDIFRADFAKDMNPGKAERVIDLLDLGCGQGLLAIALEVAQRLQAQGQWPAQPDSAAWMPLQLASYLGIEYSAANVARARSAFIAIDPQCHRLQCVQGNIVDAPYPFAKIIALIDVLHYLNYQQQEQVLVRARSALAGQGQLLLRVGNAEARQSNRLSQRIDRMVSLWRGADSGRIYCRGLSQWMLLLESLGFVARVTSSASSMFYSNVMIVAELR
jgi:SAM-dependent methyltransferase